MKCELFIKIKFVDEVINTKQREPFTIAPISFNLLVCTKTKDICKKLEYALKLN